MRLRMCALVIALAIVAAATALWARQARTPGTFATDRWEYRVVIEAAPSAGSALSSLGQAGWELAAVVTQDEYAGNARLTRVYYYLKRRIFSDR